MHTIRTQGGWAGFVMILIVLAIVGWLSRDALMAYFGSVTAQADAARAEGRTRLPTAAPDAVQATPSMATPVERARGVEATVQQQSDDLRRRIDTQAR